MALANGVLVHGPRAWACAVRTRSGELKVVSRRKRLRAAGVTNPVLRGPAKMVEAFSLLPVVKRALPVLVAQQGIDLVIANAENATDGSGLTIKDYRQLRQAELGHVMDVRAAGLPERSAPAQCQRANRQAGLQHAAP